MAKHHDTAANIAKRVQVVAQLKLRHGWGSVRIAEELAKHPELQNPVTKKPYDASTVRHDLIALKRSWLAEATRDMAELKAQHLASIREARGESWAQKDMGNTLRALDQESKLLGLDAPAKVAQETTGPGGGPVQVKIQVVYADAAPESQADPTL